MKTLTQYGRTYSDPPERIRHSGRGIVIENGKILLSYEINTGVYMTPGGGIEENETLKQCCVREINEETGYKVEAQEEFLTFNEYSFETLYISHYFPCTVTGKSENKLTDIEIEHGMQPVWLDVSQALSIFATYPEKREDIMSLYKREYTVIYKYLEKN